MKTQKFDFVSNNISDLGFTVIDFLNVSFKDYFSTETYQHIIRHTIKNIKKIKKGESTDPQIRYENQVFNKHGELI